MIGLTWLRRLICRHRTMLRSRERTGYYAVCSWCGYREKFPSKVVPIDRRTHA
jgi:hypothetical protein